MKKQNTIIGIAIVVALIIDIIILYNFQHRPKEQIDENALYTERFGDTILKFERYDYVLSQNMIVGVEKSIDGGKTFNIITQDGVVVSNKAMFEFMSEELAFIISTENLSRSNGFIGFKVTQDGGKTFTNSKFNYDNPRVDILHIDSFPYYDEEKLNLDCTVYDLASDGNGYQDYLLTFVSEDNGLTWNLK